MRHLSAQTHELRGTGDGRIERLQIHRLLEKIERALLHRAHRRGDIGVPREHDDAKFGIVGPQGLEQHQSAGVGEPQVNKHHVGRVRSGGLTSFTRRGRSARRIPKGVEKIGERLSHGAIVVNDEHRDHVRPGRRHSSSCTFTRRGG